MNYKQRAAHRATDRERDGRAGAPQSRRLDSHYQGSISSVDVSVKYRLKSNRWLGRRARLGKATGKAKEQHNLDQDHRNEQGKHDPLGHWRLPLRVK